MSNPSSYERTSYFWGFSEPALLRGYGDDAAWERIETVVEDIAATVGHYGFAIEGPRDPNQFNEKLSPAETGSERVYHSGGEYAQPTQGFPPTLKTYVVLRSLGEQIPPVPTDETS